VKSRVISGVLAVIAILALSATAAQAGAGGTPSALTSFFVCHGINGDDPGQVVDLESPVLGPNRQNVRIGNGTLACAFAKLFRAGTTTEISPGAGHGDLKCYTVSVARQASSKPPTRYTVTDELFGEETDVQTSEIRYICAPATFTR
jgi:hypothetical protein